MEKPGMDRRPFRPGAGLLGILFACFLCPVLPAQDGSPGVQIYGSPDKPVRNTPWTVSVLVDHPFPIEVTVRPPELPGSLILERIRTEPRNLPGKRKTLVEFLFVPKGVGTFFLDPFEVITPGGRTLTPGLTVQVLWEPGINREYRPQLVWEAPSGLVLGESGELSLRVYDWDPRKPLTGEFPPPVMPEHAVMEKLPVSRDEREEGLLLRLRVIPLEGPLLSLGGQHLHYEGAALNVPPLDMRVAPAPIPAEAVSTGEPAAAAETPEEVPAAPAAFPETGPKPFVLFRPGYDRTVAKARALWEGGQRAEALAELRRGERDLSSGYALAPLRRAAERSLGIDFTGDEKRRPRRFFMALVLGGSVFLPLVPLIRFFRSRRGKALSPWALGGILGIVTGITGLGIFGLAGGMGKLSREVVLRACAAYRVPEIQGAVTVFFTEGQPARIRSEADVWAYAESPGGKSGWVLREKVIFY